MPSPRMTSFESYNAKTTSISYPWPAGVTGLERIALSAQGDLQRVLSAFFAHPITIALVSSHTLHHPASSSSSAPIPLTLPAPHAISNASPSSPITQTRQVHLMCRGRIACTATSTVRITAPEIAHLFLEEKYAIGQMFRRLERVPAFELVEVGVGEVHDDLSLSTTTTTSSSSCRESIPTKPPSGSWTEKLALLKRRGNRPGTNQLWRKYKLVIPDFECEILEVFPERSMFVNAEAWLAGEDSEQPPPPSDSRCSLSQHRLYHPTKEYDINVTIRLSRANFQSFVLVVMLAVVLVAAFEGVVFVYGWRANCQRS